MADDATPQNAIQRIRQDALPTIWQSVPGTFVKYTAPEKATTYVKWNGQTRQFETTTASQSQKQPNMHAEMSALETMLKEGKWVVQQDGRIIGANQAQITTNQYWTDETHCSFCTVMLAALDLPIRSGWATQGNHRKANEQVYPLPAMIRKDPAVLGRLLTGGNAPRGRTDLLVAVKQQIDPLLANPADGQWALQLADNEYVTPNGCSTTPNGLTVLTWKEVTEHRIMANDLVNNDIPILEYLWRLVYRAIYLECGRKH